MGVNMGAKLSTSYGHVFGEIFIRSKNVVVDENWKAGHEGNFGLELRCNSEKPLLQNRRFKIIRELVAMITLSGMVCN